MIAAFRFRTFSLQQTNAAMKVGTDSVLLAALAALPPVDASGKAGHSKILDVGTGTGIIALLLAQRFDTAHLIALEPDPSACIDAAHNFAESPYHDRIELHRVTLQTYVSENGLLGGAYDLVISCPPYFNAGNPSPDGSRSIARTAAHTSAGFASATLSHPALISGASVLLSRKGVFTVVLPYLEGLDFVRTAALSGLYCSRFVAFRTRPAKPVLRVFLSFSRSLVVSPLCLENLCLYAADTGEAFSSEWQSLLKEAYAREFWEKSEPAAP